MKATICAVILALAIAPAAAAADQGKSKEKATQSKGAGAAEQGKAKEKPTQSKEKPTQSKGKGKGATPDQPAAPGSQQGAGSCSPDTTAPVIHSVSASPNVLRVPNHKMTPIAIQANVTDNCPGVTWTVTAIASDEPVNGTGDGDTAPDWQVTSAHAVSLRSERAGTGDGRVYTITITARDAANNTSTGTTTVTVPHNR